MNNWSVIATDGFALGQVSDPVGLAADPAGNLYVSENYHSRILQRDAQGSWSTLASAHGPGSVYEPVALAVDTAGNLYVSDDPGGSTSRIQKRDAQGNWSEIATEGTAGVSALAVDAAGNLSVAWTVGRERGNFECPPLGAIAERDAQGNWSEIDPDPVMYPTALAVDGAGNLFVAEQSEGCLTGFPVGHDRIETRDAQGNWSVIGDQRAFGLAADSAGNLYVAAYDIGKRDALGNWSVIATGSSAPGAAPGQVYIPTALAVDTADNLYVADSGDPGGCGRIQKRDAQGNWSVIATEGNAIGQVGFTRGPGLAVDAAGNLYVADTGNNRVQKYTPVPGP